MLRILTTLLLACLLGSAHADQRAETRQQLESARKDIAELKKLLGELQQEKSSVQKQLKQSETEMGNLQKQVDDLEGQLDKGHTELERLDGEKKKLQQSRIEQQRLIGIQARAAYQSGGRQEYLKMLLNQQDPEQFSRTLTYYDYLSKARFEQINTFNETIRQLANVEREIETQQERLSEQKDMLASRKEELARVHDERKQALAKLNTDLAARDKRLKARQDEQAQLNQVLKTIEETLARQAREAEEARQRALAEARRQQQEQQADTSSSLRKPIPSGPVVSSSGSYGGPFSSARGKLPWPVDGRLIARFGSQRGDDSRSKWDGVLIGATEGSTVRAIHGGRVVFADWLRGAGQLVILDHGNGYLSLYGHNQRLLKSAGDIVKAGEPIATVGNSGGQDQSALYFAIRQQGRASDPVQWCRAQG
ncbi:murein hydrolase activator EnvC family protein [Pseudomonas matsuisoli]|uniref:Peptidase M23 n=1 Tax=Pseudomonas matsuisoli TaxID=1515666 RepID=A0A917PM75_9PSED|nr:murein hydrolase activator EnvC [Pseudomonas matsuisoli]GGJ83542.1 peptidase M23 [Pseudomonas matsuisoli]